MPSRSGSVSAASRRRPTPPPHLPLPEPPQPDHPLTLDDGATDPWITHSLDIAPSRQAQQYMDREWLLTNGTGAFAMGSLPGIPTRRYHGLFIASTHPPVGRIVALNQVLEQLILTQVASDSQDGKREESASNSQVRLDFTCLNFHNSNQGDIFSPQGASLLRRFERGLHVCWTYTWGQVRFIRELHLQQKQQAATLKYRILAPAHTVGRMSLRLAPMVTLRDFHALAHKGQGPAFRTTVHGSHVVVSRDQTHISLQGPGQWERHNDMWWYNVHYRADAERGQDCTEDYYLPGAFVTALQPGKEQTVTLTVCLGKQPALPQDANPAERLKRLESIEQQLQPTHPLDLPQPPSPKLRKILALASDDFVVDRRVGHRKLATILAGYPWFADWGRDTFIAMPGLLLEAGRFDDARATLQTFAHFIKDGLVPNRFDDYQDAAAHYNTVDASLWFIHAALEYHHLSQDQDAWHQWLADACLSIMNGYIRGTQHGIRMAGDGLIAAGSPSTQLTWMDAAANGQVFTPRCGKAIEINALWYYLLVEMAARITASPGLPQEPVQHFLKLADRIRRSFAKVFWDDERNCLFDHVYTDEQGNTVIDRSLRPNQVLVASLPQSPLPRTKLAQVMHAVKNALLTPAGLRTLPTDDPNYHGRFTGPQYERDRAYHQGTIWPWLIGPYAEAVLRLGDFSTSARHQAYQIIHPLLQFMEGPGLGQLPEIFEADPDHSGRHRPVGCPAQAWSVAQVLRVLRLIEQ